MLSHVANPPPYLLHAICWEPCEARNILFSLTSPPVRITAQQRSWIGPLHRVAGPSSLHDGDGETQTLGSGSGRSNQIPKLPPCAPYDVRTC